MNNYPFAKRVQIVKLLVEGNSIRSTSRIVDCSVNTVIKVLIETGRACEKFHNETVRNLECKRVQADEIWSFVYSKQKNVPEGMEDKAGDVWTWTAIDADTRLIVSYAIGSRDVETAYQFMMDVSKRVKNRMQLTTDGFKLYIDAVNDHFGRDIDFAQLTKIYGSAGWEENNKTQRKYSPAKFIGSEKNTICGNPDDSHISTSYVERQNLTMRMHMRRFTRLTNAFSKKIENHYHAIALHFVYYNFVKIHKTLRVAPAMEAGLIKKIMTIEDIVRLVPEKIATKRGSYKKRDKNQ